jgi:Ulp1 family protease
MQRMQDRKQKFTINNLRDYDLVFFPANIDNVHWVLLVVEVVTRTIHYVDSLHWGVNAKVQNHVLDILGVVEKQVEGVGAWQTVVSQPSKQEGAIDCGFHVVWNMDAWACGCEPWDVNDVMKRYRDRLAYSVLQKKYMV